MKKLTAISDIGDLRDELQSIRDELRFHRVVMGLLIVCFVSLLAVHLST